jgi:hypothetical protein
VGCARVMGTERRRKERKGPAADGERACEVRLRRWTPGFCFWAEPAKWISNVLSPVLVHYLFVKGRNGRGMEEEDGRGREQFQFQSELRLTEREKSVVRIAATGRGSLRRAGRSASKAQASVGRMSGSVEIPAVGHGWDPGKPPAN